MLKEEALYGLFLEVKGPHGEIIKEKERIGELGSKEEKEAERKALQNQSPKNGNNYNIFTVEFFGNSSYDNPENPDKVVEDIGYDHYGAKEMEPFKGPAYIQYNGGPRSIEVLVKARNGRFVWKNKAGASDTEWYIFPSYEDALKVQKEVGGEIMSWNEYTGETDEEEYYYNFDIVCNDYLKGGTVHEDVEAYASSYEDLIKLVNEELVYDYLSEAQVKEYKDQYGDFGIELISTDDPFMFEEFPKEELGEGYENEKAWVVERIESYTLYRWYWVKDHFEMFKSDKDPNIVKKCDLYTYEEAKNKCKELSQKYDAMILPWYTGKVEISDGPVTVTYDGKTYGPKGKIKENVINESVEDDFWHLRDLKEPKYGTGNLIIDGNKIRPLTKDELKFKFAVSIEHADKGDIKSREELEDFAKKINAEKIMFYFQPGDNYSGEYSFLISDRGLAKKIKDEYDQFEFAEYDEDGEYYGVTESLSEDVEKEIKISNNKDIIKDEKELEPPIKLDYFPNNMGINLCSVKSEKWTEQDDGQLKKIEIDFITPDDLEEDIEKHETLNDKIFDAETQEMLPEVREKLLEIADNFVENVHEDELDLEVKDIVLIGSNANYNYTKDSDLDVHIIASSKPDCNKKHLNQIYQAYKSMFNKNYDITIHGIPTEIYVEMDEVNARSGGIYSIKDNKWLKQPKQFEVPDIDYDAFYKEFGKWEERYFELINYLDEYENASEEVDKYIDDIYEVRKDGIAKGGEFDIANLVFKECRNRGYLDHLKELKTELASKEMSLESIDK